MSALTTPTANEPNGMSLRTRWRSDPLLGCGSTGFGAWDSGAAIEVQACQRSDGGPAAQDSSF
jgi:hypothetical protein